jgi:hypothetical protein
MYDAGVRRKLEPVKYCTTWLVLARLTCKQSSQIDIRTQSKEPNRNERAKSLLSSNENGSSSLNGFLGTFSSALFVKYGTS